jgi:beta-phosphoglucomutase
MTHSWARPVPGAVLWDLDGTLVDSGDLHWRAWRETIAAEGLTVTDEQFRASFGQRNDLILRGWFGDALSDEDIRRIGEAKEARFRALVAREGVRPAAGAAAWVTRLAAAGWRQAIASSAPRANVEAIRAALPFGACFQASVAAEDVRAGKPDPDVFLLAAARLGVEPERCVVVEDAAAGIAAARRAGMRAVGVGPAAAELADVGVGSLAELPPDTFERLLRTSAAGRAP